nr:GH08833p [Drosophila melanogaster]
MRASTHGLVINIIHSLCTCTNPSFSEEAQRVLRLSLDEFSLPKFYLLFGISKVKSAAVTAFRSSCRHPTDKWLGNERVTQPLPADRERLSLPSLEVITDALLEIMEACMRDVPDCEWLNTWTSLARSFAFCYNPALQPRALIVYGCISKSVTDHEVKQLLRILVKALESFNDLILIEALVMCLTRIQPLLRPESPIHRALFWVAISVLQLDEITLYGAGLALLEQNLHTLKSQGCFDKKETIAEVMMKTREKLEWHFKQLDHAVGLSFRSNFHFALVGHLIKGFRHPTPTTVSRTSRVLTMLLGIIAKPLHRDKFEVTPDSVAYLTALVAVSEEVRSRCHVKHALPRWPADLSSSVENGEASGGVQAIGLPLSRRQKSWDILDQSALQFARQHKVPTLQERGSRSSVSNESNVLLDPEVLPDLSIQALVLTVLATLVKYSSDEGETRVLYQYLAEGSVVFPKVFPVIHSLLDQKINNILSVSHDQVVLNSVQNIIQNMLASEDPSQQQLHFLQSCGFGGLWRFAGPFTKYNMMGESSELFVNCLEAMVETCLPGDESAPVPPSPRPYNLSSSLSSLTLGSPTDKECPEAMTTECERRK